MVVDRVEVSASCGMEPFLPLGSVVRIGLPAPFLSLRNVESHFGVALNATGEWRVFPLLGNVQKNRSSWLAISRMWCIVCVLPEREFPSQASHKAKESAS